MNSINHEEAHRILADLIAIPSVNPMGQPFSGSAPVEREVADYIHEIFQPFGLRTVRQQVSALHENLLIEVPGCDRGHYVLLESHMDTVPADDWQETAFTPRCENGLLIGRGACDDKGPLTAMILAVREVLMSGKEPPHSVALLAAGDEEYAQTGIKSFVTLNYPLVRSIVGEATRLRPVVQHKGTIRWDITVHGRSAHTSQPELGRNAILDAMRLIEALSEYQKRLNQRFRNPLMSGPTLTVTMIHGGRTRNAVPDECTIAVDFRVLPGMDAPAARQELMEALSTIGLALTHSEVQIVTPPLNTQPEGAFSQQVLRICREITKKPDMTLGGVPYGSDASWVADQAPAIVLGPGTIDAAHAINEFVEIDEVVRCAEIYHRILMDEP